MIVDPRRAPADGISTALCEATGHRRPAPQRLPSDHPDRVAVANEVHARPYEALYTPQRAEYLALTVDKDEREREIDHLAELCRSYGVVPPASDASHFSESLGTVRVKWERHTEFSGYTFLAPGDGAAGFGDLALSALPQGWVAAIPGKTVVAARAKLAKFAFQTADSDYVDAHFGGNVIVGGELGGTGAGIAFTDFQIDDDGYVRFLLLDRHLVPRQAGRMLQRLFEIESYRVMALLALPVARSYAPQIMTIERSLASLAAQIARDDGGGEALLGKLTGLAADVESAIVSSQYRFGASRAYYELVRARIAELKERSIPGIQTIGEFMERRLAPAMATCFSVSERLRELSERVAQASGLLSTRVEIAREKQNQSLLSSMDRRAKLQLRLQQTVEGLSVAAITYYVVGLVGYAAKGLKASGMPLDPEIAMAASIPIVIVILMMMLRRVRHKLGEH